MALLMGYWHLWGRSRGGDLGNDLPGGTRAFPTQWFVISDCANLCFKVFLHACCEVCLWGCVDCIEAYIDIYLFCKLPFYQLSMDNKPGLQPYAWAAVGCEFCRQMGRHPSVPRFPQGTPGCCVKRPRAGQGLGAAAGQGDCVV